MKASLTLKTWSDVRDEVEKYNAPLAKVIDGLNPGKEFRLYEGTFPYGCEVVRAGVLYLPNDKGQLVRFDDPSIEKSVSNDLGYNFGSNPFAFMLEGCFEVYTKFDDRIIPLHNFIVPGTISGTWQTLTQNISHYPSFLWNMSSGARSIFMLSKISETSANNKLKRAFGITENKPQNMMDHWDVFRQIANHPDFPSAWQSRVLFFSEEWVKHLNDDAWKELQRLLLKTAWANSEFWRNQFIWNIMFSLIQKNQQIRANAHIVNTVQHLLMMGAGFAPGFVPATDDSVAPVKALQEVYVDVYQLRNYAPIMMHPSYFKLFEPSRPIYYSLQYPTASTFSPKSSGHTSTISDLYEVKMVMDKYLREIRSGALNVEQTLIKELIERVEFDYFHSDIELYHDMKESALLPVEDPSFDKAILTKSENTGFPGNSSFVRGCIRVRHQGENETP